MVLGREAVFVISKLKNSSVCFLFLKLSIIIIGTLQILRSKYSPGNGKNWCYM